MHRMASQPARRSPTTSTDLRSRRGRLDLEVTDEQVAFFHENGYVARRADHDRRGGRLVARHLRPALRAPHRRASRGPTSSRPAPTAPSTSAPTRRCRRCCLPEHRIPELRETIFYRNGMRAASASDGSARVRRSQAWGHMITKPAGNGDIAPWHQDEAYWEPELRYQAVGTWMAARRRRRRQRLPVVRARLAHGARCSRTSTWTTIRRSTPSSWSTRSTLAGAVPVPVRGRVRHRPPPAHARTTAGPTAPTGGGGPTPPSSRPRRCAVRSPPTGRG